MERELLDRLNQEADLRGLAEAARGLSLVSFEASTLPSPFNASNTTLIVDVSKYVPVADLSILKANGVRGIIARIGQGFNNEADPTWAYYVQAAYDNDMPCFGYWVIDPSWPDNTKGCVDEQMARIKKFVANKKIQGIYVDSEIYRMDNGNIIAPGWISERTRSLCDELQRAFPDLITGVYTAGWVIDGYSPQMKEWVYKPQYNLWWAYYTVTASAEIDWKDLPNYYPLKLPTNLVQGLDGKGALTIWQWTGDRLKLDGMWSRTDKSARAAADLNFFMGPEMSFYEWCGFVPKSVPEPPPPPPPDEEEDEPGEPPPPVDNADLDEIIDLLKAILVELRKPRVYTTTTNGQ